MSWGTDTYQPVAFPDPPPASPFVPPPPLGTAVDPELHPVWRAAHPAEPRQRRLFLIAAIVAAGAVVLAVAGGVAVRQLRSNTAAKVTFAVPTGWQEFPTVNFRAQEGLPLASRVVGIDVDNAAIVQTYRLGLSVDSENLTQVRTEIDALVHRLLSGSGGKLLSGPVPTTLGSLPAFRYQITTFDPAGRPVQSRLVFAFSGATEYMLNCQHTAEHAVEVEAGCDQISRTFEGS